MEKYDSNKHFLGELQKKHFNIQYSTFLQFSLKFALFYQKLLLL